ncbi:MAG: NADH-quinone oxidoreductase subunit NuoH [Acidobacteria bacterium]|nr:NADH-quinone oxidoreductase subunit NuoH [Acidobacteriota bacterium]
MSHLTDFQTFLLLSILKIVVVLVITLTAVAYTVLLERKVLGRMQNRWGPSRVGPFGLLQPLADGIKLFLKEDLMPMAAERPLFILAPIIALTCALISIAVVPFGAVNHIAGVDMFAISDINIGLLVILGITSIGVYGIALSGWSSNNKFALLGSLRATSQVISYELALGLSLVGVVLRAGSLRLRDIVDSQSAHGALSWNIFGGFQIVAFFIYLMAAYAETNRAPFDLPEAESELVAGYHTEYSSMKFAMFFMAEYANMITVACVATLLFFGGPSSPLGNLLPADFGGPILSAIFPVLWFVAKVFAFLLLYIWVRATLPRFRYDQLMSFGWKFLLPVAILNILATSLVLALRS